MPRHARLDAPGTLHHVMARGIDGIRIFIDDADRARFLGIIETLVEKTGTRIPAWSIMENHFHLLIFSGPPGLPALMRKVMTRYAVYFNRRHHRTGHLFQNRYKSVLCEEEVYFLELVRYIHLNPLRAGVVTSLDELDGYPWCGHSAIMGRTSGAWQDRMYVVRHFSNDVTEAVRLYRAFVDEGKERGKRRELTGGGLIRSLGGAPLPKDSRVAHDARILGSGEFVERMLGELERRSGTQPVDGDAVIAGTCAEFGIHREQLRNGSRRKPVTRTRLRIIEELVIESGFSLTEVARLIGISPSGVANLLKRNQLPDK